MDLENSLAEITRFIESKNEWLLLDTFGKSFALTRAEIEISLERGKIIFAFLGEKGFEIWRVTDFKIENEKILLELVRNFKSERKKIRLVPRVSASELSATIEVARLAKANQIADLLIAEKRAAKIIRVALNDKNGRFAQIVFEDSTKRQIAALADVSELSTPEILLSNAIFWLARLENRTKKPINEVWLLAVKKRAGNLQKLHALLDEKWKSKIKILEISAKKLKAESAENSTLKLLKNFEIKDLWH